MTDNDNVFLLAYNGPYLNRGCEAITRGTVKILEAKFRDPEFLAISAFACDRDFKKQAANESDARISHKKLYPSGRRFSYYWTLYKILNRTFPSVIKHIFYKELKPAITKVAAVLSVGGDNYSYEYGRGVKTLAEMGELVLPRGKPLVIWAASIGPFSKDPEFEQYMMRHLRKTHILARETATMNYLAEHGLENNVYRVGDPAFVMDAIEPANGKLDFVIEKGAVGLNFSPLMARYAADGNRKKWVEMVCSIVSEVAKRVPRKIYLVSHVTGRTDKNDYHLLQAVHSSLRDTGQIVLVPPVLNAAETKWIISQMGVFAGARMHSTVAAFSSYVPTLSFAYSIKAQGMNKDIYGHTDYCLDPSCLKSDVVAGKICELLNDSSSITTQLESSVNKMKELAMSSGDILYDILTQNNAHS